MSDMIRNFKWPVDFKGCASDSKLEETADFVKCNGWDEGTRMLSLKRARKNVRETKSCLRESQQGYSCPLKVDKPVSHSRIQLNVLGKHPKISALVQVGACRAAGLQPCALLAMDDGAWGSFNGLQVNRLQTCEM
ncbi:hypothetical protein HAX54_011792 [Datura stramonium]|uniref:Uncharacterized protein n=1 Tax=Datura stramonium TaxID=4076 RepID=A0ABS8TLH8_DATST|nr:hypothetical protein [Datura stramonium]